MSRLKDLRKYVDKKLNKIEDEDKRTSAISHVTIFRHGSWVQTYQMVHLQDSFRFLKTVRYA